MEYNEIDKYIPKNKFDKDSILKLMAISEDEIKPILPELLSWTADINWPIAKDIVHVLVRFPNCVVPLIKEKLKSSEQDEDWKYFIITDLIPELPIEAQKMLADDMSRIINNPTDDEKYAEVWDMAKRYRENYQR